MGRMTRGILEAGMDVRLLEIRKVLQDLFRLHPTSDHCKHLANRNSHPTNGRLPSADVRNNGDAIKLNETIL